MKIVRKMIVITIGLLMIFLGFIQAADSSNCSNSCSKLIRPDTLLLVKKYFHGAPIQSVDFMCDVRCGKILAALGGYTCCCQGQYQASIRAFELVVSRDELQEIPIDIPVPSELVYSVNWCCIEGVPYLAVGGCPDSQGFSLWIYKYDSGVLRQVTSFKHKGTLYAVAWLCYECTDLQDSRYLAIGGDPDHDGDIKILSFAASLQQLECVHAESHGATVYALDWCIHDNRCPFLVIGGKKVHNCIEKTNFRIYKVSCEGNMILARRGYFEGGTVRTVSWCCSDDKFCPEYDYLLVGGDRKEGHCGSNIRLYCYDCIHDEVVLLADAHQKGKIFTAKWVPDCKCRHIIAGSGCSQPCKPNVVMYTVNSKCRMALKKLTGIRHDDNITSLAWCKICDSYYLLVGSERNRWNEDTGMPCCEKSCGDELALYKGVFCKPLACQAKPICKRSKS